MPTVVIAPLLIDDGRSGYTETSISVQLGGGAYLVSVAELAAVEARVLQAPVANLSEHEDAIRRALDRVFTGF